MRNLRVYEEAWPLHTQFVIARGSRSEAKVVVPDIVPDGHIACFFSNSIFTPLGPIPLTFRAAKSRFPVVPSII